MLKISKAVEKMERRIERKIGRLAGPLQKDKWRYICLGGLILYFYAMLVNSIRLGINTTFGAESGSIIEWNPFKNLLALFSPVGIGVTFFIIVMALLSNKNIYHAFSGYKYARDKRGFDIIPDGTHGTSGFMEPKEMDAVLEYGKLSNLKGTVLGKIKEHEDDPDEYADYISPKPNTGLNDHIIVYGASGAGKSRGFVKPFALQCAERRESLILVDPKGEFYESMSQYFRDKDYVVKAFNLLDMENSDAWNIMADIETDKNLVQSMAEVIIRNTSNANERQDFWEKAELNLFMALIHYVQRLTVPGKDELLPIEQRSLEAIYKMLSGESFADIEQAMNDLPNSHPAKAPYGIFRLANRQIWGNIAIGLGNRLSVFQNEMLGKITSFNEIDMELPGKKPCAYFCIISDQDSSLEFFSSLFFSTLFTRLSNYARRHGINGRLPVKTNICLDEFCNIGKILDFKKTLSVVRSRNIACQLIVQSVAQLSDRYQGKEWEELVGNADFQLFLGCNDQTTADFISKKCGYVSIRVTNNQKPVTPLFSPVLSTTRPYSQTSSNTQRALMLPDEVLRLPNSQALVFIRGQKPLQVYKIIPNEFDDFSKLRTTKISDYIPEWRANEIEAAKKLAERKALLAKKVKEETAEETHPLLCAASEEYIEEISENNADEEILDKPITGDSAEPSQETNVHISLVPREAAPETIFKK